MHQAVFLILHQKSQKKYIRLREPWAMDLDGLELESTEQIVCELLNRIENKKYDNSLLVECYKEA